MPPAPTTPAPRPPILVLGNRGMLAAAVTRSLCRRGVEPVGVDRDECDVTDPDAVETLVARVAPATVINCSAYTAVDRAEAEEAAATRLNGDAVGHIARACRAHGATLAHVSTDFVFDGHASQPYPETAEPAPLGAYGRSKLAGERALLDSGLDDYLLVRTAWLYGPWVGRPFPKVMVDAARAGKPLRVVADQHGSPTMTLDLAEAICDLLAGGHRGLFHVTGAGRTTWFDFTREVLACFKVEPASLDACTAADWAQLRPESAPRPAFSVLDCAKAERALGRPLRDWRVALRDYRDLCAGQP